MAKIDIKQMVKEELNSVIKEDTYLGTAGNITVETAPAGFLILSTQSGARISFDKKTFKEFIKILKTSKWYTESTVGENLQQNLTEADKFWMGSVPKLDDFQKQITDEFVDGKTRQGPWATMSLESFKKYGVGLGLGRGQLYQKQPDGKWKKIEG